MTTIRHPDGSLTLDFRQGPSITLPATCVRELREALDLSAAPSVTRTTEDVVDLPPAPPCFSTLSVPDLQHLMRHRFGATVAVNPETGHPTIRRRDGSFMLFRGDDPIMLIEALLTLALVEAATNSGLYSSSPADHAPPPDPQPTTYTPPFPGCLRTVPLRDLPPVPDLHIWINQPCDRLRGWYRRTITNVTDQWIELASRTCINFLRGNGEPVLASVVSGRHVHGAMPDPELVPHNDRNASLIVFEYDLLHTAPPVPVAPPIPSC